MFLGVDCGIMEKVWDELRKIEEEANALLEEAVKKSKAISEAADREAEKMVSNAQVYAEDDVRKLREDLTKEIDEKRIDMLEESEDYMEKIRLGAVKRRQKAVDFVVDQVLGE